jgi:hypothetical protein
MLLGLMLLDIGCPCYTKIFALGNTRYLSSASLVVYISTGAINCILPSSNVVSLPITVIEVIRGCQLINVNPDPGEVGHKQLRGIIIFSLCTVTKLLGALVDTDSIEQLAHLEHWLQAQL